MKEFIISVYDINLRVICSDFDFKAIRKLMQGHAFFKETSDNISYTLIISNNLPKLSNCMCFSSLDKWFNNAGCDSYIDNISKTIYMTNIHAQNISDYQNFIKYFVCNVFNRLLEERSFYAFHSSCVTKDDKGIAFIGSRGSGKTNSLLNMMDKGFNSVSNDKLAMMYSKENIHGYGVAQDISIRMDKNFRSLPLSGKYIQFAEEQGLDMKDETMLDGNNIHLYSSELAKINGVYQVPITKMNTIIFPVFDPTLNSMVARELSFEETKKLLEANRLPLVHETKNFLKNISSTDEPVTSYEEFVNGFKDAQCYQIYESQNTSEEYTEFVRMLVK